MNSWPFIVAAYSITGLLTLALSLTSLFAMRRAEADAESLRK